MKEIKDYIKVTSLVDAHGSLMLPNQVTDDEAVQVLHYSQLPSKDFISKLENSLEDKLLAEIVLKAARQIITVQDERSEDLLSRGFLSILFNVMLKYASCQSIQVNGCGIIGSLLGHGDNNRLSYFRDECLPDVAQVLLNKYNDDYDVKTIVLKVLSDLARDQEIRIRMYQMGMIEVLINNSTKDIKNLELCQLFVRLMTHLACTDLTRKEAVNHGAITSIATIMASFQNESELPLDCCLAFMTFLIEEDSETLRFMCSQGVIKQLLDSLKSFNSDARFVSTVLNVIDALPSQDDMLTTVVDYDGITILLSAARAHQSNHDVIKLCSSIIASIESALDKHRSNASVRENEVHLFMEILQDDESSLSLKYMVIHLLTQYASNEFNHRLLASTKCIDDVSHVIEYHIDDHKFLETGCHYLCLLACGEYAHTTLTPKVIFLIRSALQELRSCRELQTCGMAVVPVLIETDKTKTADHKSTWIGVLSRNMKTFKNDELIQILGCLTLSTISIEDEATSIDMSKLVCNSMSLYLNSTQLQLWGCRALSNIILNGILTQQNSEIATCIVRAYINAMVRCPDDGQLQLIGCQSLIRIAESNRFVVRNDEKDILNVCRTALKNYDDNEALMNIINKLIVKMFCCSTNKITRSSVKNKESMTKETENNNKKQLSKQISDEYLTWRRHQFVDNADQNNRQE